MGVRHTGHHTQPQGDAHRTQVGAVTKAVEEEKLLQVLDTRFLVNKEKSKGQNIKEGIRNVNNLKFLDKVDDVIPSFPFP